MEGYTIRLNRVFRLRGLLLFITVNITYTYVLQYIIIYTECNKWLEAK